VPLKDDPVIIQTSVFSNRNLPFLVFVNMQNFFVENVDVFKIKLQASIVFELCNFVFQEKYVYVNKLSILDDIKKDSDYY